MARLFDGDNDSLESSSSIDLSGTQVISIAFWLYWDSFVDDDDLALEFSVNQNNNDGSFMVDPNSSFDSLFAFVIGADALGNSGKSFNRPSSGAWHHYVAVFDKGNAGADEVENIWVDGEVPAGLNSFVTTNHTDNFGNYDLYFMSRADTSLFGAGRMAEFALWSGAKLTIDEARAMAKGYSPLFFRPGSRVMYTPLIGRTSPEIDLVGGNNLIVNGATVTPHPAVIYPTQAMAGLAVVAGIVDNIRRSALTPLTHVLMPGADGVIAALDRQQAAWLYSGIAAAGGPVGPAAALRTLAITGAGI